MTAPTDGLALEGIGLAKTYWLSEENPVHALRGVDLAIPKGERVAIMGASGGGKSTLLNLLGTLAQPSDGTLYIDGTDVASLTEDQRSRLRNREIGFVFQQFNLIPRMTAAENVALALIPQGVPEDERLERARATLEQVGLGDRSDHRPMELSGGQQQRVAVARALVTRPTILLADEPTGQLDSTTSTQLLELLAELNETTGVTVVIVTHDPRVVGYVQRTIHLRDGIVVDEPIYDGVVA